MGWQENLQGLFSHLPCSLYTLAQPEFKPVLQGERKVAEYFAPARNNLYFLVLFGSSLAEIFQEKVQAREMLLWVKSIQVIIWGCEEASENLRQKKAMNRVIKAVLWAPPVGRADQRDWSPVLLKVCMYGLWLLLFISNIISICLLYKNTDSPDLWSCSWQGTCRTSLPCKPLLRSIRSFPFIPFIVGLIQYLQHRYSSDVLGSF